jgi:hypothetical protein
VLVELDGLGAMIFPVLHYLSGPSLCPSSPSHTLFASRAPPGHQFKGYLFALSSPPRAQQGCVPTTLEETVAEVCRLQTQLDRPKRRIDEQEASEGAVDG